MYLWENLKRTVSFISDVRKSDLDHLVNYRVHYFDRGPFPYKIAKASK
jgi:hypothetical protein